jgi:hypothetical protein
MTIRALKLESEGTSTISSVSLDTVLEAIRGISARGPSFFTLTDEAGSYVQAAGARLRLTIEFRRNTRFGFRHYVLGKPGKAETATSINYSGGAVTLQLNEILALRDAEAVFQSFFLRGDVPPEYILRDTTDAFSDRAWPPN